MMWFLVASFKDLQFNNVPQCRVDKPKAHPHGKANMLSIGGCAFGLSTLLLTTGTFLKRTVTW